jgi:hypothetical protein
MIAFPLEGDGPSRKQLKAALFGVRQIRKIGLAPRGQAEAAPAQVTGIE